MREFVKALVLLRGKVLQPVYGQVPCVVSAEEIKHGSAFGRCYVAAPPIFIPENGPI